MQSPVTVSHSRAVASKEALMSLLQGEYSPKQEVNVRCNQFMFIRTRDRTPLNGSETLLVAVEHHGHRYSFLGMDINDVPYTCGTVVRARC